VQNKDQSTRDQATNTDLSSNGMCLVFTIPCIVQFYIFSLNKTKRKGGAYERRGHMREGELYKRGHKREGIL